MLFPRKRTDIFRFGRSSDSFFAHPPSHATMASRSGYLFDWQSTELTAAGLSRILTWFPFHASFGDQIVCKITNNFHSYKKNLSFLITPSDVVLIDSLLRRSTFPFFSQVFSWCLNAFLLIPSLAYVQYLYSICTVYVRFRSVHILYIYCTNTVHMPYFVFFLQLSVSMRKPSNGFETNSDTTNKLSAN